MNIPPFSHFSPHFSPHSTLQLCTRHCNLDRTLDCTSHPVSVACDPLGRGTVAALAARRCERHNSESILAWSERTRDVCSGGVVWETHLLLGGAISPTDFTDFGTQARPYFSPGS
eukprot:Lithocolla_globosa_v1_NODE_4867_length_1349_cov_51.599691.p3 type:complete len:115 gc:universal NODE_4867_length_1349_cov_51.599691:36-380(+)